MTKRFKIVNVIVFLFLLLNVFSIAYANDMHHNLGIGIGVPFGGILGINYE